MITLINLLWYMFNNYKNSIPVNTFKFGRSTPTVKLEIGNDFHALHWVFSPWEVSIQRIRCDIEVNQLNSSLSLSVCWCHCFVIVNGRWWSLLLHTVAHKACTVSSLCDWHLGTFPFDERQYKPMALFVTDNLLSTPTHYRRCNIYIIHIWFQAHCQKAQLRASQISPNHS